MQLLKFVVLASFMAILAGCSLPVQPGGQFRPVDSSKIGRIVIGKTTSGDVQKIFGKPIFKVGLQSDQLWSYRYNDAETMIVQFDNNMIVSRLTIMNRQTKTIQILGGSAEISTNAPIYEYSSKARLVCDSDIRVESIDGINSEVIRTNDASGEIFDILNFGDIAHGGSKPDGLEEIFINPGNHRIGLSLGNDYYMIINGIPTHEEGIIVYQNCNLEPGKKYWIYSETDKSNQESEGFHVNGKTFFPVYFVFNGQQIIGMSGWTITTGKKSDSHQ